MLAPVEPECADKGWRAMLDLRFGRAGSRTVIVHKAHRGPLCIQKPFHPGDGSCHVYVLHPPGGLAGGDQLELDVAVGAGAAALITMPASTKFYRSTGAASRLVNRIEVAAGAALEWVPPETILFGGSQARIASAIDLDRESVFLGWEALALGRPLSGDEFATGRFEQRLECRIDGRPVLFERLAASAGDALLRADWGLGGHTVIATLLAWPGDALLLAEARSALHSSRELGHGATLVDGLLVARLVGAGPEAIRDALAAVRRALAPVLMGRPTHVPRIWNT